MSQILKFRDIFFKQDAIMLASGQIENGSQ